MWGSTGFILKVFLFRKKNLFLVELGLRCCVWPFSGCREQGLFIVAARGLLIFSLWWPLLLQSAGSSVQGPQ